MSVEPLGNRSLFRPSTEETVTAPTPIQAAGTGLAWGAWTLDASWTLRKAGDSWVLEEVVYVLAESAVDYVVLVFRSEPTGGRVAVRVAPATFREKLAAAASVGGVVVSTVPTRKGTKPDAAGFPNLALAYTAVARGARANTAVAQTTMHVAADVDRRVACHRAGGGAAFTRKFRVEAEVEPATRVSDVESWERAETLHRMRAHGVENVRGWMWTTVRLSAAHRRSVREQMRERYSACRACGEVGHFVAQCPGVLKPVPDDARALALGGVGVHDPAVAVLVQEQGPSVRTDDLRLGREVEELDAAVRAGDEARAARRAEVLADAPGE
jgi:hypothetical protein